jgi:hypothetical protein
MRLLSIAAMCIWLIACSQTPTANFFSKFWNKQAQEEGRCPNVRELVIGMTTQEVANACGSIPRQAVHAVTADGERQEWSYYTEAYLVFVNGKLARIQREQ